MIQHAINFPQIFLKTIQVGDEITKNERGQLVNISQLERIVKPRNRKQNMDYKRKYERALERAKEMVRAMTNIGGVAKVDDIVYLFPELKKDEDEKMREEIINYLEQSQFGETHYCVDDDIVRDYIAWLEKQGEQKPAWSEEDEKMVNNIIDTINDSIQYLDVDDIGTKARFALEKEIAWLKSLKQRMKGK